MKEYPSIQAGIVDAPIYAFDKLDGSNIRAEWARKRGFYKFGKRSGLLDASNAFLQEAEVLVLGSYANDLERVFVDERWQHAVCFFEFHGRQSFAGNHESEPHKVTLFDVAAEKKGILEPRAFLKLFADRVDTAALLYHGKPNEPFVEDVRSGALPGMTFEGVVCKGALVSPGRPLMFKIKSRAWVEKVKAKFSPQVAERLL